MSGLLTHSRMKAYRACQRLHQISYVLGYRPATVAAALFFGSLFHVALEAWWKATGDRLAAALDALHAAPGVDGYDLAKARALIAGYDVRWGAEVLEVLAVEVEFQTALINPATGAASKTWRLGGKIDAVVRDAAGRELTVEHKTSAADVAPGADYWRQLRLDPQISIYMDGAKALGFAPEGCLYDVIGKPGIKPLKATPAELRKWTKPTKKDPEPRLYASQRESDETPDEYEARVIEDIGAAPGEYFQRAEIVRLDEELAECRRDVWQQAQQMRTAEVKAQAPKTPEACGQYGRPCSFLDVCCGQASLEDSRFRQVASMHEELSTPAPF